LHETENHSGVFFGFAWRGPRRPREEANEVIDWMMFEEGGQSGIA
jgi:hypothetical protein